MAKLDLTDMEVRMAKVMEKLKALGKAIEEYEKEMEAFLKHNSK